MSQQQRGVALVSNGPAMALPSTYTSCPRDELRTNEQGGVAASIQPSQPPLTSPSTLCIIALLQGVLLVSGETARRRWRPREEKGLI